MKAKTRWIILANMTQLTSILIIVSLTRVERKWLNILLFISSLILYILLIVEVILTKNYTHADDHSLFLTYVILIPSLLIFVKQFNINVKTHLLRNYSTGIYFVHRFILALVTLTINTNNNVLIFSLTLLITIVLLSLFYKINNTMINKIIK